MIRKKIQLCCFFITLSMLFLGCDFTKKTINIEGFISLEEVPEKNTIFIKEHKTTHIVPKTQKEFDELFGITDSDGNFYPPVGSYRDPVNGTIFNSNGIVIWANEEPHSSLPGSKG